MRERGSGLLVHVSSIAGRLTWPFYGLYCAGKYALEALAEAYRYELSGLGVDSVIVEPGPYPTSLVASRIGPDDARRVASYGPIAQAGDALIGGLEAILAGSEALSRVPLDIRGTAFQRRVWQALCEIPLGTTVTYTELARRIGAPAAVRAVAGACAANVLAVAVPCHRVVRLDAGLAGYRWGVERKRALLEAERAAMQQTEDA